MSFRPTTLYPRICVLLLLLCLAACASSGGTLDEAKTQAQPQLPFHRAAWAALEQQPGIAGRDFDPERIIVSYRQGAQLPPGWPQPKTGAASAASQANAVLRQNKSYEVLTDALSRRYGMSIRQQVY